MDVSNETDDKTLMTVTHSIGSVKNKGFGREGEIPVKPFKTRFFQLSGWLF